MPVDPKTGKEYPYTDEGIAQHKKDTGGMPMKSSGFKMKSGNTTPFKQMGSSPAKAEINPFVESMNKSFQGVKGTTSPNPNFNWTGSSAETEKFGKYQNQPKTPKGFNIEGSSAEGPITADKYKAPNVKKPILSKIKDVGSKILKHGSKALRIINPLVEAKLTYDIISHGVKNIKEGKAKIPKGHYKKGGKGYKKRDYSKSFDYSSKSE